MHRTVGGGPLIEDPEKKSARRLLVLADRLGVLRSRRMYMLETPGVDGTQGSRSREMEEETRRKCVRGHDIGDVPFPLKRGVHSRGDICVRMAGATPRG